MCSPFHVEFVVSVSTILIVIGKDPLSVSLKTLLPDTNQATYLQTIGPEKLCIVCSPVREQKSSNKSSSSPRPVPTNQEGNCGDLL